MRPAAGRAECQDPQRCRAQLGMCELWVRPLGVPVSEIPLFPWSGGGAALDTSELSQERHGGCHLSTRRVLGAGRGVETLAALIPRLSLSLSLSHQSQPPHLYDGESPLLPPHKA